MQSILLTIEYDGSNYSGWQRQPNGLAIQQVVEEALQKVTRHTINLRSSGRTDAGVHALAMPAVFQTPLTIPLAAYIEGTNRFLPCDIAIKNAIEVGSEFSPIRDAIAKHYRYTILNSKIRSPIFRLNAWHIRERLNIDSMKQAAKNFEGTHDFSSFRASNCGACTSKRRIDSIVIEEGNDFITIDVTGGGFLKNMVRIMTGTLVEIGKGRFTPDYINSLLQNPDRKKAGVTAPAHGLCLIKVYYP